MKNENKSTHTCTISVFSFWQTWFWMGLTFIAGLCLGLGIRMGL